MQLKEFQVIYELFPSKDNHFFRKGPPFENHSLGWDLGLDCDAWMKKAGTTFGTTLPDKFVLFAVLPIHFVIMAGSKTRERSGFVNFFFKMDL
jgi:hypothetical protein